MPEHRLQLVPVSRHSPLAPWGWEVGHHKIPKENWLQRELTVDQWVFVLKFDQVTLDTLLPHDRKIISTISQHQSVNSIFDGLQRTAGHPTGKVDQHLAYYTEIWTQLTMDTWKFWTGFLGILIGQQGAGWIFLFICRNQKQRKTDIL